MRQNREEFERRLHMLREQLEQGKMLFCRGTERGQQGLMRASMLPNGRLDLLSIDESTRLQANMIHQFYSRMFEELSNETTDVVDPPA
jgi:hypothetical protein